MAVGREIKKKIRGRVDDLFAGLRGKSDASFAEIEKFVIVSVFTLGRLLLAYFLALRQERSSSLIRDYRRRRFTKRAAAIGSNTGERNINEGVERTIAQRRSLLYCFLSLLSSVLRAISSPLRK